MSSDSVVRAGLLAGCVLAAACEDNPYSIGRFTDETCAAYEDATFCSGFERPDLSEWGRTVIVNAGDVQQTDAAFRSGRGALLAQSSAQESVGAVAVDFPAVFAGELFLRVYMLVPSGQDTMTTNVVFLGDEPAPDPFKGIDFNFEAGAPEIFLPESDPVRYTSTTVTIPRDEWFCFQVRLLVSEDAGAVQVSVGGAVALDETGLDTLPAGGVHLLRAGVDWSSLQTTPFAIYMDDLVLSRSSIPCDE